MKVFSKLNDPELVSLVKNGAIGVLPTDTLYGLVAVAANERAVERLYVVKNRKLHKPFIVLAASFADVEPWVQADEHARAAVEKYWPGPVSIILPTREDTPTYLTRGGESLAIRVPASEDLQQFLQKTGPLVAPSANPEDQPSAESMAEAQHYFGEMADFYVDGGFLGDNEPSTLIAVENADTTVLRGELPH